MGSVEDIFAGAGSVGSGSNFEDLPQLRSTKVGENWVTRQCTTLLTLTRLEAFTAVKSEQDFVSAEFHVTQVLASGEQALIEGSKTKAMWCLDRKRSGQLTFRGEAEMKRVKAFFAAMFIQNGIVVTDANCGPLMSVSCKGAMGAKVSDEDATMLGFVKGPDGEYPAYPSPIGTQVVCRTYDEGTRSDKPEFAGKTYATEAWSAPPKA